MANIKFYRGTKALGKPNNDTLVASSNTNANSILFIKGTTKAGVNNNTSVGRIYLDSYAFGSSIYDVAVTESTNLGKISLYGIDGNSKEYHVVNTVSVTDNSDYVNLTTSSSSGNVTLTLSDSIGTALNGKIGTGQVGEELTWSDSSIGHKTIPDLSTGAGSLSSSDGNKVLMPTISVGSTATEGYTLVTPGTSAKFVNINVKYPVVNAFGHTVAKNESSFAIQLPDEAFKDTNTTYTADTELSLSGTTFKHNAIGLLSKERTTLDSSTENVLFKPEVTLNSSADNISTQIVPTSSNRFIGLNVKYPVVNKYGHTVGLNTSIFSIQLPNTAFLNDNTTYSVTGNYELTSQGTEFRHETMGALSKTEESTTIGTDGLKATVTAGNSASTTNSELSTSNKYIKFTFPYPKVNEFGHIFAKGDNSISIKLPDEAFSDTTYTADTAKELTTSGTNKFAHEEIASLSQDEDTAVIKASGLAATISTATAASTSNQQFTTSNKWIKFSLPYPKVNAYGHVINKDTKEFTIQLPENAYKDTTYSASGDYELKLDGTEFKHETIELLSTKAATDASINSSAGNTIFAPSMTVTSTAEGSTVAPTSTNKFVNLSVKFPAVNEFGHVVAKNTQTLSIQLPDEAFKDTTYDAASELYKSGNIINHRKVNDATYPISSTTKSDLSTASSGGGTLSWGGTTNLTISDHNVNEYGHVVGLKSTKLSLTMPSKPVTTITSGGSVESGSTVGALTLTSNTSATGDVDIKLSGHTVNGAKASNTNTNSYVTLTASGTSTEKGYSVGDVTFTLNDSSLVTAIDNLKAKDQFLKSVTYIDASTSNITYTTHSDESIATFAFKGDADGSTIAPTYQFAQGKYPVKTSFPALFFVWYTNVTDVSSDRDDLTTTGTLADYTLVPIAELKDPHYTFNSAASTVDKGVVFTTQTDTAGNVTVSATANLVWNEL